MFLFGVLLAVVLAAEAAKPKVREDLVYVYDWPGVCLA